MLALITTHSTIFGTNTILEEVDPQNVDKIPGLVFVNFGGGRVGVQVDEDGQKSAVLIKPDSLNDIKYDIAKFFFNGEKECSVAEKLLAAKVRRYADKFLWREVEQTLLAIRFGDITVIRDDDNRIFACDGRRNRCYLV